MTVYNPTLDSGGTVTNVSVVSLNGLAGTVANPTTTPAITLSTTITGILKGNGTAISAATAGTDYQEPISLTTTGTSGAATFVTNTLNIPQYTTPPGGSDGDLQINNSGVFGTIAGLNLNKTGNARGASALDLQSLRTVATQVASGNNAIAIGVRNTASGGNANAFGSLNVASSVNGSAFGIDNRVTGILLCAGIGYFNTASGNYSLAIGNSNTSSGYYQSVSIGHSNLSRGTTYSSAIGSLNTASGSYSSAIGSGNIASAGNSTAIGCKVQALGSNHTKIGFTTKWFNVNSIGLSIDNDNALTGLHSTSNVLATDTSTLGSELVTNGTFTGSATGWTLGTGWAYSSNKVGKTSNGTGTLSQTLSITAGKYYYLSFTINGLTGTLGISLGGNTVDTLNGPSATTDFTYKVVFKATTTGDLIFTPSNTGRVTTIDNVTVKEIISGDVQAVGGLKLQIGNTGSTLGEVTLIAGTATVNTTKITATSKIFLTAQGGTLTNIGFYSIGTRTAGTSFVINSSNVLDTSTVAWMLVEPL